MLGTHHDGAYASVSGLANDGAGQDAEEVATSPPVIRKVAGGLVAGDEHDIGPGTQHGEHGRGGGEASHETSDQKVRHALHRPSLGGGDLEGKLEIAIERLGSEASAQIGQNGGLVDADDLEAHLLEGRAHDTDTFGSARDHGGGSHASSLGSRCLRSGGPGRLSVRGRRDERRSRAPEVRGPQTAGR